MPSFFSWLCYVLYKHFMQKLRRGGMHVAAKVLLYVFTNLKKTGPLESSNVASGRKKGKDSCQLFIHTHYVLNKETLTWLEGRNSATSVRSGAIRSH